ADQRPRARLDHPLRRLREAPGRPRRLVARARRPRAGRSRGVVDRDAVARRLLHPVREAGPGMRAERSAIALFLAAAAAAIAFPVVYAFDGIPHQTQLLGLTLGLALIFLAAACWALSHRVEEHELEDYPPFEHEQEQVEIERLVEASAARFTRRRLLVGAGGLAGAALTVAMITPAASL